jgi:hypothetical protein
VNGDWRTCSCGKPAPEDGGKHGVCECCSTCTPPPRPVGPGNAREVLTVGQAAALADRIREAVDPCDDTPALSPPRAADVRDLDRWVRALHRAHEGLRARWARHDVGSCGCGKTWSECPDVRRYNAAAADASEALRDLAGLYGVSVPT